MQSIFRRRENKYLITGEQQAILQEQIMPRMKIDQYGEYLVQNLYYDTDDWEIIRESLEKPLYREKLRLRYYGQYRPESQGFLELKKKYDGITFKRRISFPLGELKNRTAGEIVSDHDCQISREIYFFLQSNAVSARIHISYRRIAYNDTDNSGLRVTFDSDILFCLCPASGGMLNARDSGGCHRAVGQNDVIMEIKAANTMPLWLTRALSENSVYPLSFSKSGVCYTKHINEEQVRCPRGGGEEGGYVA